MSSRQLEMGMFMRNVHSRLSNYNVKYCLLIGDIRFMHSFVDDCSNWQTGLVHRAFLFMVMHHYHFWKGFSWLSPCLTLYYYQWLFPKISKNTSVPNWNKPVGWRLRKLLEPLAENPKATIWQLSVHLLNEYPFPLGMEFFSCYTWLVFSVGLWRLRVYV